MIKPDFSETELERVRSLAMETAEYANSDIMAQRRINWSKHNSMLTSKPLIYIRAIPFDEFLEKNELKCTDPFLRSLEKEFLLNRYRMTLDDDYIIEPFVTVRAVMKTAPNGPYGLAAELSETPMDGGSAKFEPTLLEEEDFEKMHVADYEIDETATNEQILKMSQAVGGILDIKTDRQGLLCSMWANDISTILGKMRGLEQLMYDPYDRPEWLHKVVGFMRDKILLQIDQTENAHGFSPVCSQNQAMAYAENLPRPSEDGIVTPQELWVHMSAQEFTTFGPDLFQEFMLDYQRPIMERYGLVAYGCCEDLTLKIDLLRQIPNLRRIAVSPFSDLKKCAEQIGSDYIASWRPNPSSAVSFGVEEDFVRNETRKAFDIFDENKCHFDITLKDVQTVSGDANAIRLWTKIVREEINHRYE